MELTKIAQNTTTGTISKELRYLNLFLVNFALTLAVLLFQVISAQCK
jgi:hypothetical protein